MNLASLQNLERETSFLPIWYFLFKNPLFGALKSYVCKFNESQTCVHHICTESSNQWTWTTHTCNTNVKDVVS